MIYLKLRKIPDNHAERFRMLESHFILLYQAIDSAFSIYLKTYRSGISQEQMEMMKDALRKSKKLAESFEKGV